MQVREHLFWGGVLLKGRWDMRGESSRRIAEWDECATKGQSGERRRGGSWEVGAGSVVVSTVVCRSAVL
jgi:hypothetical protein